MNVVVDAKPTTRRYTPEQKEQAVRMVFALRAELGADGSAVSIQAAGTAAAAGQPASEGSRRVAEAEG